MVWPEAVTPEIWWPLIYLLIPATVGLALANPLQKAWYPTIRDSKSGRPPNGCTGLQARFRPSTASAAVTGVGGEVSHCAPARMVTVYVLPPLEITGAAVARSGATVVALPGMAGLAYRPRTHIRWPRKPIE